MRTTRSMGVNLLGIWLLLTGIIQFVGLGLPGIHVLMGILAFVAGLLILAGR
jgi:hypothetical protein